MNWVKQQLANVAGTQEPIYGPSAIQSVADQAKSSNTPHTELRKDDLRWVVLDSTNVETQTFYITADNGYVAMAQVIYSNIGGIKTTAQFNSKVFYPSEKNKSHLWTSDPLNNYGFDKERYSFHADKCALTLSEDGSFYTIKSTTNLQCVVNLKFSKAAPGFVVGKNGSTTFGTDPQKPWGSMRHAFWPRCKVEGTFMTKEGEIDMQGSGCFIHALQGMKPHHAAARWNFANFQSPKYTAVMMEYSTPPSYGTTVVNVGGIAMDGKLVCAGSENSATHTKVKHDQDVDWPEPGAVSFKWHGKDSSGQEVNADVSTDLTKRTDRVDVMSHVPGFVKQIVAGAAGTRPYIYQYIPKPTLNIKIGSEDATEQGTLFMESTFIS